MIAIQHYELLLIITEIDYIMCTATLLNIIECCWFQ